ncbi:MAG: MarR family transcriptional regulator, partial [Streptosporangiaceae bacterium]
SWPARSTTGWTRTARWSPETRRTLIFDQPTVLSFLDSEIGQTPGELGRKLGISRQAAEKQLKRLEEAGKARWEQDGQKHLWYPE